MNFHELALKEPLLRVCTELGFESPTLIQEKIIPSILNSRQDIIGLAQTGTGKTAAFGLPILEHINPETTSVQALVLCPTRELGMQITKDLASYSKYLNQIKMVALYGGANIAPQIQALKKGVHIVVGTPGRTLDLIKRKVLKVDHIEYLVLDEADEMLNMGFKEELDAILAKTRTEKQTMLFSATMPDEIRQISRQYMNNPMEIVAGKKNVGAEKVNHEFYITHAKNKYLALKRIVDINPRIYGIVFCRTRRETKEIADKLMQDGYNADALHGDLSQSQRDFVMNRFRIKHLQLLVATDVAARGLDVGDLTHVIHFNLPDENEAYIHRSGRTGRAGKRGTSVSLIHTREQGRIKSIEKKVGQEFMYKQVPNGREICEKQLFNLVDKVENIQVDANQIGSYMPEIYKKLEWLSREDLIQHFVSVEFNHFLSYYKNAGDINARFNKNDQGINKSGQKIDKKSKKHQKNEKIEFSRFYINIGTKNGLTAPKMIGLIKDNCSRRDMNIGKIDMMKKFSFFEVESRFEKLVLNSFQNKQYEGVRLKVEPSEPDYNTSKKNKRVKKKQEMPGEGISKFDPGVYPKKKSEKKNRINDKGQSLKNN